MLCYILIIWLGLGQDHSRSRYCGVRNSSHKLRWKWNALNFFYRSEGYTMNHEKYLCYCILILDPCLAFASPTPWNERATGEVSWQKLLEPAGKKKPKEMGTWAIMGRAWSWWGIPYGWEMFWFLLRRCPDSGVEYGWGLSWQRRRIGP